MSQIKDSLLTRVDNSMIWYSLLFNKHKKWLSHQTLTISNFFFSVILFLNTFDLLYNCWVDNVKIRIDVIEERFFFNLFTYIIDFSSFALIINIFFQSNLVFFKEHNLVSVSQALNSPWSVDDGILLEYINPDSLYTDSNQIIPNNLTISDNLVNKPVFDEKVENQLSNYTEELPIIPNIIINYSENLTNSITTDFNGENIDKVADGLFNVDLETIIELLYNNTPLSINDVEINDTSTAYFSEVSDSFNEIILREHLISFY